MSQTQVRIPRTQDAAELAGIHVQSWRDTYSHLLPDGFFTDEFVAGRAGCASG